MALPSLTRYELNQKLILIAKKEDDNMNRLLHSVSTLYPSLTEKRLLIIDDEADLASVSAQKKGPEIKRGKVTEQIDQLRDLVKSSVYLQVTATPYSLYLQPEEDQLTPTAFSILNALRSQSFSLPMAHMLVEIIL